PREGGDPDSLDSRLRGNERRTAAATRPRVSGFTNLGCRKRAPGRFRCFRIVFYNEWRNFNVWVPSARSDAAAAWLPGPPALREARLSYGAALSACCEHADVITEELGMSHLATGWSRLRAWSASHGPELRLCVRSTTAAVATLAAAQLLNLPIAL